MKTFKKKILSTSVSAVMTLLMCSAIPMSSASDISIYSDSQKGKTGILLMLDTSGSMGISSLVLPRNNKFGSPGDVDSSLCNATTVSESGIDFKEWTYNLKSEINYGFRVKGTNETVDSNLRYARYDTNNTARNRILYEGKYYAQSNTGDYVKIDIASGSANAPKEERAAIRREVTIGNEVIPYYVRGCSKNGTTQYDRLSRLKDAVIPLLASQSIGDEVKIGLGHFSTKTEINVGTSKNKLVDGHSGRILVPLGELDETQRKKLIKELAAIESVDTQSRGDGSLNANDLKLTSTNYPNIFKASSGTPTAHAYAEAAAYLMGTTTGRYPRTLPSNTTIVYDGYAVIKNNKSGHADYGKQLYYVCVGLDGNSSSALGATAMHCDNEWNRGMDKTGVFYDSGQKRPGDLVRIFKPNPTPDNDPSTDDEWIQVTPQQFKVQFEAQDSVWAIHKVLPIGWRWGGWLKVENEPMDIEPIGSKVWDHHSADTKNLVSYRSSPFSLESIGNVPFDNMVGGLAYSVSTAKISDGTKYKAGGSTSQCDGNGIYFLTDGAPNSTRDNMAQAIMNLTLTESKYQFQNRPTEDTLTSPRLQASVFAGETGGWEYIGAYAKKLRDKTQNPGNMTVKTAVVGFGSSFEDLKDTQDCEALVRANPTGYNKDAYNACKWGSDEYGGGGFYYAENSDDIRNSILDFVRKVEVDIKPVATGTPTIPVDTLNPTTLQNNAYYASFQPTVSSASQMWVGNLNKYKIQDGELFSANGLERLISTSGALNDAAQGFWTDGVLGQLKVGANFLANGTTTTHRKIFTNRSLTGSIASAGNDLQVVDIDALFDVEGAFAGDSDKIYWLNALGYKLNELPSSFTKDNLSTYVTDKRLGAIMHSTPVMLTQEGRISNTGTTLTTTARKDYLMYGSTQGILHVVDVSTGQEVFGFLPHEMMTKQKEGLLLKDQTAGGMSNLFYGIDAPWVAHTQYTTKADGLLTVKDSDRKASDEDDSDTLKGHQWVYGGLRMGGKSYYALDLSDIAQPKMIFHINPSSATSGPFARMGQSWSKPTLGYVNWGGSKKLVMFVGGGYDAEGSVNCASDTTLNNKGYECPTYNQTNKIGAGVYMFDAQNGDLLWWSSVDDNNSPSGSEIRFTENVDLQYSVVGQINAIDRNADGLVDHLYFGDLAGQAFRVDLNNSFKVSPTFTEDDAKDSFGTRTVTLFTEHVNTGLSPRFYEMPSFTVHRDVDTGNIFAVAAFSSGNRSSPLAGVTEATPTAASITLSANDGIFAVYDNDVANRNLYDADYSLRTTKDNALETLVLTNGVNRVEQSVDEEGNTVTRYPAGWKHAFSSTSGAYKGMNDIYALDNMLYANVYHKDGTGISGSCGGGVKGDSYLFQYCLPYGKCGFYSSATTAVNRVKLGAGILGTGIGQGYNNKINTLGLIVNRDDPNPADCSLAENKNLPQCQLFDNAVKLQQLRWYEYQ